MVFLLFYLLKLLRSLSPSLTLYLQRLRWLQTDKWSVPKDLSGWISHTVKVSCNICSRMCLQKLKKKNQPIHVFFVFFMDDHFRKTKILYYTGPWKWACWLSVSKFTRTPGGGVTIKPFLSVRLAPNGNRVKITISLSPGSEFSDQ